MSPASIPSSSIPHRSGLRAKAQLVGGRAAAAAIPPEVEASVFFRELPSDCGLGAADRRILRRYASRLNLDVAAGRGFDCLVTNDQHLRGLNRQFLGHDYATDVLSFPSGARKGPAGELAISVERAAAQAREFGHSLLAELQILMLHGVLHLVGCDHETDDGEMAQLEHTWRVTYDLPAGLIGRQPRSSGRMIGRQKARAESARGSGRRTK